MTLSSVLQSESLSSRDEYLDPRYSSLATGNNTSPQAVIAGIKHRGLARGDGALSVGEADPALAAIVLDQGAGL